MGFTPNWPVNYDPSPGEWSSMWASKLDQTNTILQTWTTALRPTSPTAGQIGFNTTIPSFEWWSGSAWITPSSGAFLPLTGGTLTNSLTLSAGSLTISVGGITVTAGLITPASTVGIAGTTTNDNVQAGSTGEYFSAGTTGGSHTVTITLATPGVITWTAHGLAELTGIVFSTSGALPTGLATGTNYWITKGSVTTNTFTLSSSMANAIAGTAIATSGSQSGTQTAFSTLNLVSTAVLDIAALTLTAGDWEVWGTSGSVIAVGGTTTTSVAGWVGTVALTTPNPYAGNGSATSWLGSVTNAAPII